MAKINNSAVMQKLIDELELYPAKDTIPSELAEKVLPVFQVNSEQLTISNTPSNVVRGAMELGGNPNTIYTTPATGKFYLTNVQLSCSQGAASTTPSNTKIEITIDGSAQIISYVYSSPPTTVQGSTNQMVVLNLQNPILVDPATTIVMTPSSSTIESCAVIVGYTE